MFKNRLILVGLIGALMSGNTFGMLGIGNSWQDAWNDGVNESIDKQLAIQKIRAMQLENQRMEQENRRRYNSIPTYYKDENGRMFYFDQYGEKLYVY